jgi:hypothetical protein
MSIPAESYRGADGQFYRVWRANSQDTSPTHHTYPTGYDSRCGHCWLNHSHSEEAHQQQIADHPEYTD